MLLLFSPQRFDCLCLHCGLRGHLHLRSHFRHPFRFLWHGGNERRRSGRAGGGTVGRKWPGVYQSVRRNIDAMHSGPEPRGESRIQCGRTHTGKRTLTDTCALRSAQSMASQTPGRDGVRLGEGNGEIKTERRVGKDLWNS